MNTKLLETMTEGLQRIAGSVARKKANFFVARTDLETMTRVQPGNDPLRNVFSLGVSSHSIVKISGGYVITMGLSRERLIELRDLCTDLLNNGPGAAS
jgi:hypothetical protein